MKSVKASHPLQLSQILTTNVKSLTNIIPILAVSWKMSQCLNWGFSYDVKLLNLSRSCIAHNSIWMSETQNTSHPPIHYATINIIVINFCHSLILSWNSLWGVSFYSFHTLIFIYKGQHSFSTKLRRPRFQFPYNFDSYPLVWAQFHF